LSSSGYVTVFTLDADCDGYSPLADCDDTNGGTLGTPGAAQSLQFTDKTTLQWSAPADPGLSPSAGDGRFRRNARAGISYPRCVRLTGLDRGRGG